MSRIITASTPDHGTISQAEAIKLAKNVAGQNARLVRYQLLPYSDNQPHALATHYHLLLDIKSGEESSEIEQRSFIVKTISHHCQNAKLDFEHESTFYRDIVPELLKHVALGNWIPKCLLAKSDTLVLGDPSKKGYSVCGPIFDEATTKSAVQSVARLHASSILAEARLEQSLYELYPKAFDETIFTSDSKYHQWYLATMELCIAIANSLGLNSSKIVVAFDRLQQIIAREREATIMNDQTKYKVVSHGSLWANNMMFDVNQPPNCVLTNFQYARYASPAQDLLLLLHLCTTRQFRQSCEQQLIEFYHSTLRTFAYRYNPAARVPSLDQMKREVEEQRLQALISAVFLLPTVLLTKNFAADVLEDPVEYDKFHRRDRSQKVTELMQKDVAYRHRIQEAVEELVDYTDQLF